MEKKLIKTNEIIFQCFSLKYFWKNNFKILKFFLKISKKIESVTADNEEKRFLTFLIG